jgi:hypothetical protein
VTDTYAPRAFNATFDPRTSMQALRVSFTEDVSASLPGSIEPYNANTGAHASTLVLKSYDAATNTATYAGRGPLPTQSFPDGNFTATLDTSGVKDAAGNSLAGGNVTFNFYSLPGDADGDRTVGPGDFNILASHFGQSGQTPTTGDFDGDGVVGPSDFNLLASRFGKTLAPPLPGVATAQQALLAQEASAVPATAGKTRVQPRRSSVLSEDAAILTGSATGRPTRTAHDPRRSGR